MRILTIIIAVLMLSTNAHACLWNFEHTKDVYQVFNHLFLEPGDSERFGSNEELFNSAYAMDLPKSEMDWGQFSGEFSVDLTYMSSSGQKQLGYMEDGKYTKLVDLKGQPKRKYLKHESGLFSAKGGSGFMWAKEVKLGHKGARIYSDGDYNFGGKDLFCAFSVTDSALLDRYQSLYSEEAANELWLLAFDGLDSYPGNYTDLVALVSKGAGCQQPVATPVPASIVLLASGLSGMAFWGRQTFNRK